MPHRHLRRALLATLFGATVVIAGCRPPIAADAGPDASPIRTDTPPPAAKLQPDTQVNVQVHTFRGFGTPDSAILYAQALDSFRQVNLVADLAPPIAGYDPFAVEPDASTVTLWVGTLADVAPSVAAGQDIVAVGELTGNDPTVLVTPAKAVPTSLAALAGKTVLAETAGAAASFRAELTAAGIDPRRVTIQLPDDPSAPFDPTPLLDHTATAAVVSVYDGWARIEEALIAAGEDPRSFVEKPLRGRAQALLGELVWARTADLSAPLSRSAVAAFLGVLAQSQVACRDAVEDCAGAAGAQSDRTPGGIAWSIDRLDRTLFPAPDGIIHVDQAAWNRTIAAMSAARVADAGRLTMTNELVDAVLAAIGPSLDVTGKDWTPRSDLALGQ